MHSMRCPHLLPQPQRHPQAIQLDLEAQRSGILVVRPAATPLKAQRRQRLRCLRCAAQRCLGGLQLVQLRPRLARLQLMEDIHFSSYSSSAGGRPCRMRAHSAQPACSTRHPFSAP